MEQNTNLQQKQKKVKKKYYSVTKDYARFKKPKIVYHLFMQPARLFHKKYKFNANGQVIDEPSIFISNHSKAFGPIAVSRDFPYKFRPWVEQKVLFYKSCPKYAYECFFPPKGKIKIFNKMGCFFASLLLVPLLRGQEGIPVYRDRRIKTTFQKTMETLIDDKRHIIIFPECPDKYSEYIHQLNSGFVQIAKIYYERTGKCIKFYPCYIPPGLKSFEVGEPIQYDPNIPMKEQKEIVATYLRDQLDAIARALPPFKPIPYMDN